MNRIIFHTTCHGIKPHIRRIYLGGVGANARFEFETVGYWLQISKHLSVLLDELPAFTVGEPLTITIEPFRGNAAPHEVTTSVTETKNA